MSKDSEERHASFRSTLELPFPLISDEGSRIAKAFGLTRAGGWLPSKRATFVIDRDGIVQKAITAEIDIGEHVRESLAALEELP